MEITKEQKIAILNNALVLVEKNYYICNAIHQACCDLFHIYKPVGEITPEFLAIKPFFQDRYSSWFGYIRDYKNVAIRVNKVNKLISLYQRDIWIEMFAWRVMGKIKSIF